MGGWLGGLGRGMYLACDHADGLAHALHFLDDVILPHVVDDPDHQGL